VSQTLPSPILIFFKKTRKNLKASQRILFLDQSMKKSENRFHKRTDEELTNFIRKLELQALETAEERLPLYLKVG